jgi:hypothetical protein
MDEAAFRAIFDELCSTYGCTTPATMAVARATAMSLASDSIDAGQVEKMFSLMPKPKPRVDKVIVEYCSNFSEDLRSMLAGAGKEDLAKEIDAKLVGRIVELERENDALKAEAERSARAVVPENVDPAPSPSQPTASPPPPNLRAVPKGGPYDALAWALSPGPLCEWEIGADGIRRDRVSGLPWDSKAAREDRARRNRNDK